jgi:hypothetical protein
VLGSLNIKIGDWSGQHKFVLANVQEQAILGLDFLKNNGAEYNYETKTLKLKPVV